MKLTIELAGDVQVERSLLRMAGRTDDMSDGLREVGEYLQRAEGRQFASEGQYGSGGWAPLAASTIASKQRQGLDSRILHATGALRDSLAGEGTGALREVTRSQLIFGTTVPYARFHQLGQGVPQRRPLEAPEGDRREMVRILQRAIVGSGL